MATYLGALPRLSPLVHPAEADLERQCQRPDRALSPCDRRAPHVTELVVITPPEPLPSFLVERGYLAEGVPLLKRVLALPGQAVCRSTAPSRSRCAVGEALVATPRPPHARLAGLLVPRRMARFSS